MLPFIQNKEESVALGAIYPDSDFAKVIGFTSDKFDGWLWRNNDVITISMITSLKEKQGNLKTLFDKIEEKDYHIVVPTPSNRMVKICLKRQMVPVTVMMDGEAVNSLIGAKLFERGLKNKSIKTNK